MHLLYFHQHFSTPQGSASTRSYETARRLVERGHQVTMVCGSHHTTSTGLDVSFRRGRREGKVDGIRVIELNLGFANPDTFIKAFVTHTLFALRSTVIALAEQYDVVFSTSTPLTVGIPGIFAKLLRRKPFVFEVRELWPELSKAMGVIKNPLLLWAFSALEWVTYRCANRLIGLSPGIVEAIAKRGISASHIKMIPNGCDMALFAAPVSAWRPVEVRADDIMAVYAGAHGQANGLDAALDAASELKRRGHSHVKLVLVGSGNRKASLVARAQREKLDNVIFLESVPKTKLAGLMASADIGLQLLSNIPAFYYGTSPNKFFDYLASGTPVLCNYPGWVSEMITLHQCGFVVTPENAKSFADALEYAANNRVELEAMGPRARQLARTAFSRDQLAEQFCKWLELEAELA
ncbi:MAG: glycosyltransferase family 4 protein [Alphaproteobacteria bacterium]|nr:glycosyltransferase family 4 protein [Alphaproteobacteria bacterium]